LFSSTAGQIADRFSKPRVIVLVKAAELLLMLAAAVAFVTENQTALLALLLGLGIQATVFGPLKYGILPEHLADNKLVAGNGAMEATTFLSILLGQLRAAHSYFSMMARLLWRR
jgi:acyl-[acyl-carrier-protein]-phospholipid O-acyltransferase/long-chain-fatty-acid--[acyl-carrier-protein] ligase